MGTLQQVTSRFLLVSIQIFSISCFLPTCTSPSLPKLTEPWKLPPVIYSYQIQKIWFSKNSLTGQQYCFAIIPLSFFYYYYCSYPDFLSITIFKFCPFSVMLNPSNHSLVTNFSLDKQSIQWVCSLGTPMQEDIFKTWRDSQNLLSELATPRAASESPFPIVSLN